MEQVLDVYRRPCDPARPVVCMDETPRQLISEIRSPVAAAPGRPARHDYEYRRRGTCNVFMATEPLAGRRMTRVSERKTKIDWARFLADIDERYADAEKIKLVMDNLKTHRPGALYEAFPPARAKALWDRFEFVHTPKHGSWLNVAEVELNVMIRQCLGWRIDSIDVLRAEVAAWQDRRDRLKATVNWQFTTDDARVKLPSCPLRTHKVSVARTRFWCHSAQRKNPAWLRRRLTMHAIGVRVPPAVPDATQPFLGLPCHANP